MINSIYDLAKEVGATRCVGAANDVVRSIARTLYNATECGISFLLSGPATVVLAGYCEGVDAECPAHSLDFPFEAGDFWAVVEAADQDGCNLWDQTHGCDDCGLDGAINPDCSTCGGNGVVL